MIQLENFKVRCSRIADVLAENSSSRQLTEKQLVELKKLEEKENLTGPQEIELTRLRLIQESSKIVKLSTTYIEYLMEVYAWETAQKLPLNKELMDLPQIRKGKEGELEAGSLLSAVDGREYLQHKDRINNDYLSGEIDFYLGPHVYEAENVTDIKNSFDYPTFLKKITVGIARGNKEQVQGYMDITGAPEGYIADCLISSSEEQLIEQQYYYSRKLGALTIESPEFVEKWAKIRHSMVFDEIDIRLRVHKTKIDRFSDQERQFLYDQVKKGRDFLVKFHEERQKLIIN